MEHQSQENLRRGPFGARPARSASSAQAWQGLSKVTSGNGQLRLTGDLGRDHLKATHWFCHFL